MHSRSMSFGLSVVKKIGHTRLWTLALLSVALLFAGQSFAAGCTESDIIFQDLMDWLKSNPAVIAKTRDRIAAYQSNDDSALDRIISDYKAYWTAQNIAPPNTEIDKCSRIELAALINSVLKKFPRSRQVQSLAPPRLLTSRSLGSASEAAFTIASVPLSLGLARDRGRRRILDFTQ
jgi:hypothetical protein